MSRKHAELERELIEDLVPRTGRSLADWMAAIGQAGLSDKNAIIDWLRPQGLTFPHASWLERIHNNGGRPIYLDAAAAADPAAPLPPVVREPAPAQPPPKPAMAPTGAAPRPAPRAPVQQAPASGEGLAGLLARGKGLRPLAEFLLREIAVTLPGAVVAAEGDLVSIGRPAELAVLSISPRELRLGLDLGDAPLEGMLVRSRIPGSPPRITHMVVVSDARQIGGALLDLVRHADNRANPSR